MPAVAALPDRNSAGVACPYGVVDSDVIVMPRLNPEVLPVRNEKRGLWTELPLVIHTPACYPQNMLYVSAPKCSYMRVHAVAVVCMQLWGEEITKSGGMVLGGMRQHEKREPAEAGSLPSPTQAESLHNIIVATVSLSNARPTYQSL